MPKKDYEVTCIMTVRAEDTDAAHAEARLWTAVLAEAHPDFRLRATGVRVPDDEKRGPESSTDWSRNVRSR